MGKRKGPLAATKKKCGGDFKKRTAKVGKRAVKQANVTKVNVRSKQLYMPTQRLAAAATSTGSSSTPAAVAPGQERTAKGQNLAELLHQTRHHNEGARVGAVQGLKELVMTFPGLGAREMAGLLDGGLELLLDPEEEVRRAALGLLRLLLLPSSSSSSSEGSRDHRAGLLPFAPLAATYLCAALSHLDQSIRRDGLAYLDLLVQSLGPHLLPHAGDILPSLAALLDRPPHPSKRQAARLLLQQKQQQRLQAQGGEEGASAKEKDQQLKARMELWAARAAVLRCALGLARLLPQQQQQQQAAAVQQAITQAPSTPVVEWRRTPRVLLLRPTEQQQPQTESVVVEDEGPEGQWMEGLAALLPRVRNYVLELSTAPGAATAGSGGATAAMAVDGEGAEGAAASASAEAAQQQGQQQRRHQVEGGPALDALAGAIEFALVATQSLAGASSSDDEEGEAAAAAAAVAVGEARGLIGALVALFPLQLADGATALRVSSLEEDGEDEEGDEAASAVSGVVTEDGLNLALAEVAMLGATAIDSSSKGKRGGLLDAGVVSWLVGLMDRRAKALGGGGTAEGERLGGRLLRLLRGLLPRLYARGEVGVAERLLGSLEACTDHWVPGAANKRTALRLLCDLLARRPATATRAWVERTARTQLPSWAAGGHSALVAPVLSVLLRAAAEGEEDGEGAGYVWLPDVVTALLEPTALGSLPREARLRVCDLLYHCPALPPALQDAVVAAVQQQAAAMRACGGFVDYLVEILHHRRQLLSPSAYLTLLGRLLALPAPTPLPYAAALGTTVGRTLRQLQQRPGSVLPMLAPLLVRLLDGGDGDESTAATRQAALVVLRVLGEGWGEEEEAVVTLPDPLLAPLVGVVLGGGVEDEEEAAEFVAASRPLLLCLLRRHGAQLLPPMVEAATPAVLSNDTNTNGAAAARFQGWLREPGLNWAPAKVGLVELRRRCVAAGQPRLRGLVHDLDLLPLGLGK